MLRQPSRHEDADHRADDVRHVVAADGRQGVPDAAVQQEPGILEAACGQDVVPRGEPELRVALPGPTPRRWHRSRPAPGAWRARPAGPRSARAGPRPGRAAARTGRVRSTARRRARSHRPAAAASRAGGHPPGPVELRAADVEDVARPLRPGPVVVVGRGQPPAGTQSRASKSIGSRGTHRPPQRALAPPTARRRLSSRGSCPHGPLSRVGPVQVTIGCGLPPAPAGHQHDPLSRPRQFQGHGDTCGPGSDHDGVGRHVVLILHAHVPGSTPRPAPAYAEC